MEGVKYKKERARHTETDRKGETGQHQNIDTRQVIIGCSRATASIHPKLVRKAGMLAFKHAVLQPKVRREGGVPWQQEVTMFALVRLWGL